MNIALSTLNIMIHMCQLPSWCILTRNPSTQDEILSAKSFNMVQVPRGIGPINRWYYNWITYPKPLRLFILVVISSFYFIITVEMIKEENKG